MPPNATDQRRRGAPTPAFGSSATSLTIWSRVRICCPVVASRLQSPMVGSFGRSADAGPTEFAPRGGDGVHSVLSPLDAATAQGSEALSLLDEEAVACISSDECIRSIGRHPLRQLVLSRLRPAGWRSAELHLPGHCGGGLATCPRTSPSSKVSTCQNC